MKKKLLIVGSIVIIILIGMFLVVTNGLSEGATVSINSIDLSTIQDGSYTGTYDFKRWSNTLVVKIKDNQITAIEIIDDVPGASVTNCSEEMFRRVMSAQNTQVDAVSGATVTSKAYLKAIENALGK